MGLGGKRPGAGRKKGFAALEAERQRILVAERIAKDWKPIVDKAIADAKAGDKHARDWLYEFAFGKPTQPTTIGDPNGDPLFIPSKDDRDAARRALEALIK